MIRAMAERPLGTVTFLFTDIEGSSRLWERDPARMQATLERHDGILRSTIESSDGFVFKTVGDAFHAAFETATDAVASRLAAAEARARKVLAPSEAEAATNAGRAMTLEGAVGLARGRTVTSSAER